MKNPFASPPTGSEAPCEGKGEPTGKHPYSDRGLVEFAPTLHFRHYDESIDAEAYATVTFYKTGQPGHACSAKYGMRATLRLGDTGGPPGSATEAYVDLDSVRLVEHILPLQAPPGTRAILPGEIVIRMLADAPATFHDKYLVSLPGKVEVGMIVEPRAEHFPIRLEISQRGKPIEVRHSDETDRYQFTTTAAGLYDVSIGGTGKELPTDRYHFFLWWGDMSAGDSDAVDAIHWIHGFPYRQIPAEDVREAQ